MAQASNNYCDQDAITGKGKDYADESPDRGRNVAGHFLQLPDEVFAKVQSEHSKLEYLTRPTEKVPGIL
jgi:hypothetical protein